MIIADTLPARVAMLCNSRDFQVWITAYAGLPPEFADDLVAAEVVRQVCGITSRRELADNAAARAAALELLTEYDRRSA